MNNSTRVMMRVLIPALVLVFAAGTLRAQDPVEAAPNKCKVLIEFQQDTQPLFGLPTMDLDILIEGVDSDGLIVRHNEISGSFKQSAILLGADPTTVNKNALIQGNNLEDVKAGVAPIWLGPGSSNNRVLNNHVTVLDQGTGNLIR